VDSFVITPGLIPVEAYMHKSLAMTVNLPCQNFSTAPKVHCCRCANARLHMQECIMWN